jgi:hypothetical protein
MVRREGISPRKGNSMCREKRRSRENERSSLFEIFIFF